MTSQKPEFRQLEKRLIGESVVVGEYTVQPVAQLTGRYMTAGGETGEGAGAWIRVTPLEVIVGKGEAEPYPVPMTNETQAALKGIALGGLLITALCWFVIIGSRIFRGYKEKNNDGVESN